MIDIAKATILGFLYFLYFIMYRSPVRVYIPILVLLFIFIYALSIGMIVISTSPLPPYIETPSIQVFLSGPIGQVPWIIIYLTPNIVISANLEAMLTTLALSMLFSLNIVALLLDRKMNSCCGFSLKKSTGLSLATVAPSLFAAFSCCGPGIILNLLILMLGSVNTFISSVLFAYRYVFISISLALLVINLAIIYRRYTRTNALKSLDKKYGFRI